jgi:hypothetical protein
VRRRSVRKFQILPEPGFVVFSPLGDIHPALRAAQNRAQRDHCRIPDAVLPCLQRAFSRAAGSVSTA